MLWTCLTHRNTSQSKVGMVYRTVDKTHQSELNYSLIEMNILDILKPACRTTQMVCPVECDTHVTHLTCQVSKITTEARYGVDVPLIDNTHNYLLLSLRPVIVATIRTTFSRDYFGFSCNISYL